MEYIPTEYRNDFTKFLDEYRTDDIMSMESPYREMMSTYLWYHDIVDKCEHIAFRLPGATRGHIKVDKSYFIREIVFYNDTCFGSTNSGIKCYKPLVVEEANKKFLNTKLDLVNGIVGDDFLYDKT